MKTTVVALLQPPPEVQWINRNERASLLMLDPAQGIADPPPSQHVDA